MRKTSWALLVFWLFLSLVGVIEIIADVGGPKIPRGAIVRVSGMRKNALA